MREILSYIHPWHFYFAIGIVLLVVEMTTFTFDLLWLGLGAMAGALIAWLVPDPVWPAMLATAAVAMLLTFAGRKWARKSMRDTRGFDDPVDTIVDKKGMVVVALAPGHMGIVKVGTDSWSAVSEDTLPIGEQVVVLSRSSTVLKVKRAEPV